VQRHIASRPIARVGEPNDIAEAIRYLARPTASWVTGQCFAVDGGTQLAGAPTYLRSLVQG
jgi:NAD(P)-dependent dehydrogenase (short-subunit alcohol dehydrogenase family)